MNIPGMPNAVRDILLSDQRRTETESVSAQLCRHMNAAAPPKPSASAQAGPTNTNGNANCDVAGVGLKHGTPPPPPLTTSSLETTFTVQASSGLHPVSTSNGRGSDAALPRLHHVLSPATSASSCMNGAATSSDISLEENGKLDRESHFHRLTSPVIADLPLMSMRSPPLSLEFAASENGNSSLLSPCGAAVATAKYPSFTQMAVDSSNPISSSSDSISCSSLSPIASISASSPSSSISATQHSLFQQGLLLDPRSPALLIQPSLTTVSPTTSQATEESMDESGPFVCSWENCNQEFPLLESLVVHLDRGHTISMDKYVCLWKDCARNRKPFDARYKLITHLRCHTGEKPYRCEYPTCTRSFSRLENLKLHVRTHTGEKPYECHYEGCTKKFNNTSDRAKHMKTHITRKPYVCKYPGCGKSYTDPSSMRKHIKYTHKLKERQEEAGYDGGIGLSNGPHSHQRSSRKRDSTSTSGSSSSPTTPNAQATRFIHPHPGIHGAVTIGHSINGQFLHTLPSPPILSATSINSTNPNAAAVTLNANQVPQPQLIPVPLVQLPGTPTSAAQPLSFIPSLGQGSPLIAQGGTVSQQQQLVMLLPSPGVTNTASRDIVALSPPCTTVAKLHQQQQQNLKQQAPLPPIHVLQQAAARNGQIETVQTPLTIINEEEQLRLQIAHLQQQLLQSQQAQLLAQQQVAQLQLKQQNVGMELSEKPERQTSPISPIKLSTSKVTIVTSSWPAGCGNTMVASSAANKSQTLITSHSSPSPPAMARKASGQIVLTSSMPILSPTGQTVLPTQLPVVLGQPTAPQVIPIVQSQGVTQRQILYMTPSTS